MDTKEDFVFLSERAANKFNPFQEGEYLVLAIVIGEMELRVLYRDFDYRAAKSFHDKESLSTYRKSRYEHHILRVTLGGKLHCVDLDGAPTELSKQQDWKIHEDYYNAGYVEDFSCGIEVCTCTYPVFRNWKSYIHPNGDPDQLWYAATCLVDDYGREVDNCPNCNSELFKRFSKPLSRREISRKNMPRIPKNMQKGCFGCKYYSGNYLLPCAVQSCGLVDDICPDYSM